jgi:transposase
MPSSKRKAQLQRQAALARASRQQSRGSSIYTSASDLSKASTSAPVSPPESPTHSESPLPQIYQLEDVIEMPEKACAHRLLSLQPDFLETKSLVEEVIEDAGHICIFLPKFHCELNFIEYFWGAVKKYLRDHCDYTFSGLQENVPKALASVDVHTIRKWEHRMIRWMEAYRSGKGAREAQKQVKAFSSHQYTSHRRVGERAAQAFDKD